MAVVSLDPRLAGLKRIVLVTSSPDFYRRFGFEPLDRPDRWMLRRGPGPAD
jgi:predicted N-acetyltransferase YhbS